MCTNARRQTPALDKLREVGVVVVVVGRGEAVGGAMLTWGVTELCTSLTFSFCKRPLYK